MTKEYALLVLGGGKDNHYQVYLMKEVMKMNPILFSVEDNFEMTDAVKHNIKDISEEFSCNIISLKQDIKAQKNIPVMCMHILSMKWII